MTRLHEPIGAPFLVEPSIITRISYHVVSEEGVALAESLTPFSTAATIFASCEQPLVIVRRESQFSGDDLHCETDSICGRFDANGPHPLR